MKFVVHTDLNISAGIHDINSPISRRWGGRMKWIDVVEQIIRDKFKWKYANAAW